MNVIECMSAVHPLKEKKGREKKRRENAVEQESSSVHFNVNE